MTTRPDFFIAGAAKSGTTALFEYLSRHPSVFIPSIKEPNFFCTDQAILRLRRAVELDPLSGTLHCFLGRCYRIAGRLDEAETAIRRSLELTPHGGFGHYYHSDICLAQGRLDDAFEAAKLETHETFRLLALANVYHAQRQHAKSDAVLKQLIETRAGEAAFQIAEVFAYRDNRDQAFAWLERSRAQRDAGMSMLRASPSLRGLHRDRRWKPFLKKVGLAE
jgi:tetratricopeptide (TPR) repeat protein